MGHALNRGRPGGWSLRALEALRPMGVVFVAFDRGRRLDTGAVAGRDVGLAKAAGIGQELFRPVDLLGQTHAVGKVGGVGLLGQRQQRLDLAFELRLDGLGVPVGQGAVTTGVGVDLGTVQTDGAEAAELALADDLEHLNKGSLERLGEASPNAPIALVSATSLMRTIA